jgi:hypothetical protein
MPDPARLGTDLPSPTRHDPAGLPVFSFPVGKVTSPSQTGPSSGDRPLTIAHPSARPSSNLGGSTQMAKTSRWLRRAVNGSDSLAKDMIAMRTSID